MDDFIEQLKTKGLVDHNNMIYVDDSIHFHLSFSEQTIAYYDPICKCPFQLTPIFSCKIKIEDEKMFCLKSQTNNFERFIIEFKQKVEYEFLKVLMGYLSIKKISYYDLGQHYQEIENEFKKNDFFVNYGLVLEELTIEKIDAIKEVITTRKNKHMKAKIIATVVIGVILLVVIVIAVKYYINLMDGILKDAGL